MNKEIVFVGRMQNKTRDYIHNLEREVKLLQQENKELHNKIDKAIEYLINPPKKIWEGHSIDEVVRILKGDVDE